MNKRHKDRTRIIRWNEYQELVNILAKKINFKKNKFDLIIAINRGGNVVGTMLSYKSGVPLIVINKDEIEELCWRSALLVDDLSDTGETFLKVSKWLRDQNLKIKTACVHVKEGTKFVPNYYSEKVGRDYIVYPYE
jgi:uncharacterized protein